MSETVSCGIECDVLWPGPPLLAHGALGPLDEILLMVVVGLFIAMFAAPTVIALLRRGRGGNAEGETQGSTPDAPPSDPPPPTASRHDHYRLD
jgi:hypothetical protein